jgi:hypothetical protein
MPGGIRRRPATSISWLRKYASGRRCSPNSLRVVDSGSTQTDSLESRESPHHHGSPSFQLASRCSRPRAGVHPLTAWFGDAVIFARCALSRRRHPGTTPSERTLPCVPAPGQHICPGGVDTQIAVRTGTRDVGPRVRHADGPGLPPSVAPRNPHESRELSYAAGTAACRSGGRHDASRVRRDAVARLDETRPSLVPDGSAEVRACSRYPRCVIWKLVRASTRNAAAA